MFNTILIGFLAGVVLACIGVGAVVGTVAVLELAFGDEE